MASLTENNELSKKQARPTVLRGHTRSRVKLQLKAFNFCVVQLGYKLLGPVDFCTGEKVKPETHSHVLKDHVVLKQNATFLAFKDPGAILVKVQGL